MRKTNFRKIAVLVSLVLSLLAFVVVIIPHFLSIDKFYSVNVV